MGVDASKSSIPASIAALRQSAARRGYNVRDIRWDPVLQRTWAIFEDTAHPERPQLAVLTQLTDAEIAVERGMIGPPPQRLVAVKGGVGVAAKDVPGDGVGMQSAVARQDGAVGGAVEGVAQGQRAFPFAMPAAPVVHRGDAVVLWSEEKNLRLQLNAVVDENGGLGERVRLHLAERSEGHWGGDPTSRPILGIVRGPGEVEMEH